MMLGTTLIICLLSCSVVSIQGLTAAEQAMFDVTFTEDGANWNVKSDGLPTHETPVVPGNPNTATAQNHDWTIPKVPVKATSAGCLPMGPIGVATNGVALFNPFTAEGNNAVEGDYEETFDNCSGHAAPGGTYHYHKIPICLYDSSKSDQLIGLSFDGYKIYGPIDENGRTLMSKDLDDCNGRTSNGEYRYHMTIDFPYILGCYSGVVLQQTQPGPPQGGSGPPPGGNGPPPGGNCVFANGTDPNDMDNTSGVNVISYNIIPILGMLLSAIFIGQIE